MILPGIKTDYNALTPLDPEGVNAFMDNIRVLSGLETGHLVTELYKHIAYGIQSDDGNSVYEKIISLRVILEQYAGVASSIANKALTMRNEMQELVNKLNDTKVLSVNGKTGNIRLLGSNDIVVGTAPADNNIVINNTQASETASE